MEISAADFATFKVMVNDMQSTTKDYAKGEIVKAMTLFTQKKKKDSEDDVLDLEDDF